VDGTFNTLLALYDPALQTDFHAAGHLDGPLSSAGFAALLRNFELLFAVNALAYLAGFELVGAMVVRARVMPRGIGILFMLGAPLVATSLVTPPWVESVGYVALAAAFAWAGFLLWRHVPPQGSGRAAVDPARTRCWESERT
jgi:hypothetical protein